MDEFLKYDICSKTLSTSAGRALGAIIGKFKSLKNVGFETFSKLYQSGVLPILEYGSGVWGYINANDANLIQNRAMRYFLGVHKFAPNLALSGETGWLNPKLSRWLCLVRFWNRLILMDEGRLTNFQHDFVLCETNWCSKIKNIFQKLGMINIFNNKQVCDTTAVKSKPYEIMEQEWKKDVVKKPKLRTYVTFKNSISTEDYVKSNISRSARSLLPNSPN